MDVLTVLFPDNVVQILDEELEALDSDFTVVKRPLRPSDPNMSLGVFGENWEPTEYEIGGPADPSLARYLISIQSLVKHANEEEGVALHTNVAHRVRTMLYRSDDLRVRLHLESVESPDGTIERVSRSGIRNQRYMSNEIQGTFVYLSITSFWIDTQTS